MGKVIILSADTLSEDEDDGEVLEAVTVRANLFGRGGGYAPSPGGPFSALIPSMWPQDLLASLAQVGRLKSRSDYQLGSLGLLRTLVVFGCNYPSVLPKLESNPFRLRRMQRAFCESTLLRDQLTLLLEQGAWLTFNCCDFSLA